MAAVASTCLASTCRADSFRREFNVAVYNVLAFVFTVEMKEASGVTRVESVINVLYIFCASNCVSDIYFCNDANFSSRGRISDILAPFAKASEIPSNTVLVD